MEKKTTIFDLIGQSLIIFGFTVIFLMVFAYVFGDSAVGYSTIFALAANGLALSTLLQFLLTSIIITLLRQLFFTDGVIKNMSMPARTVGMFATVIAVIVLFVCLFDWFPVNDWLPWVMFVICFIISSLGGFLISLLKERTENKKMQEALERMQEGK